MELQVAAYLLTVIFLVSYSAQMLKKSDIQKGWEFNRHPSYCIFTLEYAEAVGS